MKKAEKKTRREKALLASKKVVRAVEQGDRVYHVLRKYVLPAACVAFAVFAYAACDVNIGDEIKKK